MDILDLYSRLKNSYKEYISSFVRIKDKRIEDFIRLVKTANTQQQALVLAFEKGIEIGSTVKESA